jgi:hypothetical protein
LSPESRPAFFSTLDFGLWTSRLITGLGHQFRGSSSYQKFVTRPNPWCFYLARVHAHSFPRTPTWLRILPVRRRAPRFPRQHEPYFQPTGKTGIREPRVSMRVETTSEIFWPKPRRVGQAGGAGAGPPFFDEAGVPVRRGRTKPALAGGCAGESSGVGRSVNMVAGAATFWSQPHPDVQRTRRRLPGCHAQRPLREHANCHKPCPRRADGHATRPLRIGTPNLPRRGSRRMPAARSGNRQAWGSWLRRWQESPPFVGGSKCSEERIP